LYRFGRHGEGFDFCGREAELQVAEGTLQNGHEAPCASLFDLGQRSECAKRLRLKLELYAVSRKSAFVLSQEAALAFAQNMKKVILIE